MSTKTTFKRVALVAVAALGFGMLTVVPSNASTALSLSLSSTSITAVGGDEATADALVAVTVTSDTTAVGLAGTEQVKFSVVGVPNTVTTTKTLAANAADLTFLETMGQTNDANTSFSVFTADTAMASGEGADGVIKPANSSVQNASGSNTVAAGLLKKSTTYTMLIKCAVTCMDQGVYTVAVDLKSDSTSILTRTLIKIDFVTDSASSGAVLTATSTGSWFLGSVPLVANMTSNLNIVGTIRNRDGGAIRSNTGTELLPSAVAKDASTTAIFQTLSVTGTAANEYGYSNPATSAATRAANLAFTNDGNFTIYFATLWTAVKGPNVITIRYGLSSATASVSMLTQGAAVGALTAASVSATGQAAVEPVANAYTVPLTTKSATYKATGATPGAPYVVTVSYTNVAAGDQTPVDATPTTVYADANGVVYVTVTNANPINGASATVNLTGFATTQPTDQVINWTKSKASAVSVSMSGAYVALKSANTFVATVTDAFGAPVAGVLLAPVVSGSNADVTGRPTLVTGTDGTASITVTDAAAIAAGTETVTFTEVGTTVSGASSITYAATAPVATTLTSYYTTTVANAATATSITTPTPATGIYASAGVKFDLENTRNTSKAVTAADGKQFAIKISTGVAGVAVKAEASTGAYVLNSITFEAASRTRYTSSTGDVMFTVGTHKAGVNTITFTSGTVTTSVAFWGADSSAARFVTLTGPATLAANGTAGAYVAAVTDRFGNPVNGVTLSISATGVAVLGGGATLTSFTTDATGSFTFQGTSTVAAGGAGSFKISSPVTTDNASIAGYVNTTAVNSTLTAGSNSATVAVTFSEGANAAEANAQAATDAAAEATDAANAATDAANAAAEAADAATAAAQDAADAVAALSTQVSEMVNALKKQITALTNLVIKIQKKVKA